MLFRQLFDAETSTYTYLLADEDTREAVLIDSVAEQVERDLELVKELHLTLVHTLETHVHADHITGASQIRQRLGTRSVVAAEGGAGCGDVHVREGDRVGFGRYSLLVRTTPGHTDGCLSFVLEGREQGAEQMVFTGDALLIRGCGRTDFQQGNPRSLYRSVHGKLLSLPPQTLLYPGHDYRGRTVTSVAEELEHNPRLGGGKTEEEFVAIMNGLQLGQPKKIDVAVAANLNCGVRALATAEAATSGSPFVAGEVVEVDPVWVAANANAVFVVDVREPDEFHGELGRVPGSVLVPLATVAERARAWERGKPVVALCRSGGRSLHAAHALRELGFREVASMRGGMIAWNAAGLPKITG